MRKVLTTQSTVTCGHTGTVQTTSAAKLKVNDRPVLLASDVIGKSVVGCTTPTSQGNSPCLTVKSVDNTPPPKLAVSGAPVLVETVKGETSGQVGGISPQPLLKATANQSKLSTT